MQSKAIFVFPAPVGAQISILWELKRAVFKTVVYIAFNDFILPKAFYVHLGSFVIRFSFLFCSVTLAGI